MRRELPAPPPGLFPRRRDRVIHRVAGNPRRENAKRHQVRQRSPGHDTSFRHDRRSCTEPDTPAAGTPKTRSTRQQAKRHWGVRRTAAAARPGGLTAADRFPRSRRSSVRRGRGLAIPVTLGAAVRPHGWDVIAALSYDQGLPGMLVAFRPAVGVTVVVVVVGAGRMTRRRTELSAYP